MKRLFSHLIPHRRSGKSLIRTIITLIAILFLINYLAEISKGVQ